MKRVLITACVFCFAASICWSEVPVNEIKKQKVLASEEWQAKYDAYKPDPARIETLKSRLGANLRIDIYLGLWCPDSMNNVPPFIRILEAVGTNVPVRYLRVERKPVKTIKYFSDKYQIERVPTFVFYRGETEIGRIIENPTADLLDDTIAILSK
jgi:hypothetical protein